MTQGISVGERKLIEACVALGAKSAGGPLSPDEERLALVADGAPVPATELSALRRVIKSGKDPLGEQLCAVRSSEHRRRFGSFYTDPTIVDAMLSWVAKQRPAEIVDCGAGSGRFSLAAARLPGVASVLAVESDAVASLTLRATAAVLQATKVRVLNTDFLNLKLPETAAKRAFVGNPPYVRHHGLSSAQKVVGQRIAAGLGITLSGLAGLHAHFVMAAAAMAAHDDVLCFLLSAEWLDVNYGRGLRDLMLDGLRAEEVHLLDASVIAFADAASTAVIICARSGGSAEEIRFKTASSLANFTQFGVGGRTVARADLQLAKSWGKIARNRYAEHGNDDRIPLGSIARVHRGVVTGANDFFVMTRSRAKQLGLENCVQPVLTRAEEILKSDGVVRDTPERRVMLCAPDNLGTRDRRALNEYIAAGEAAGIHERYVPSHRKPWWKPQVLPAPPIVATYMTRQAPAFALNPDRLAFINVIHGLYPLNTLDEEQLRLLVEALTILRERYRGEGRTYQGGLEKFEPREMERLTLDSGAARTFAMLCDG